MTRQGRHLDDDASLLTFFDVWVPIYGRGNGRARGNLASGP
jgi:hypothetical protein